MHDSISKVLAFHSLFFFLLDKGRQLSFISRFLLQKISVLLLLIYCVVPFLDVDYIKLFFAILACEFSGVLTEVHV